MSTDSNLTQEMPQYVNGGSLRAATVAGILLIVIGIVGLALGGFSYTHE